MPRSLPSEMNAPAPYRSASSKQPTPTVIDFRPFRGGAVAGAWFILLTVLALYYGSRAEALVALVLYVPSAVLFAGNARRVRVIVDHPAGELRIQRPRFLFRTTEEVLALSEVKGARLEDGKTGMGGTITGYRVALTLEGGARVLLEPGLSRRRASLEDVARRISKALSSTDS